MVVGVEETNGHSTDKSGRIDLEGRGTTFSRHFQR
jgi:hypothetical protein